MKTIKFPNKILERLEQVEGKNLEEKVVNLLKGRGLLRLRECDEYILKYEMKYGMNFEQFKQAWDNDQIKNKRSREVERDFMEWEGFVLERQKWLSTLRDLKG